MQEQGAACWPRPRCAAVAMAVQVLVTLTGWAIFHQHSFASANSFRSSCADRENDSHRHLLDFPNSFSSSTKSSSSTGGNGITGELVHRPWNCAKGSNSSVPGLNVSSEAERVQQLKCALEKSSSRVSYLLTKKSRNREAIAYGLPTKDISLMDDSDSSGSDSKFVRELLDSPEWADSYESEMWSQPGEYLMNIEVGSPARKLQGIVDTGSDLTWIQCSTCFLCYDESDPIYEPQKSSTYRELDCVDERCESLSTSFCSIFDDSCEYMYTYGDSSYTYGTLSTDTFTLRSTTGGQARGFPGFTFGCSHISRGTFSSTRADGVVALGRGAVSLASQLGTHLSSRFGYCLVSRSYPTSITSPIYFGDAAILTGRGAGYTPLLTNKVHPGYYYMSMTGISVGGNRVDISPAVFAIQDSGDGGTLIDSGTTVTNLIGQAYDALSSAFAAATQYPASSSDSVLGLCFNVGGDSEPRFPTLVFHLDGVDLDLPQENYIVEAEDYTLCLAIDRSSDNLTIIGNVQQQNYRILYDTQSARMGFQLTDCAHQ